MPNVRRGFEGDEDDFDETHVSAKARLTALAEVRTILEGASTLYAPFSCPATAECCVLATSTRPPWVWPLEWQVLQAELERQGRVVPPPRADGACRLLSPDGRCTVYGARPFGCRTFFCHRRVGPQEPVNEVHALDRELTQVSIALDASAAPRTLEAWLSEHD